MQCPKCLLEMLLWQREEQQVVYQCPKCHQEYKKPEKEGAK